MFTSEQNILPIEGLENKALDNSRVLLWIAEQKAYMRKTWSQITLYICQHRFERGQNDAIRISLQYARYRAYGENM